MEYKVITAGSLLKKSEKVLTEFQDNVNEHLRNGWKPLGGISTNINAKSNTLNYFQALIKE